MFKDIFGVVEKVNTRPLLISLIGVCFVTANEDGQQLLRHPISWRLVALPPMVIFAYGLVWVWVWRINCMNSRLSESDIASIGVIVGCCILSVCLVIAFSYLAAHPQGITLAILGDVSFIRFLTLILLAMETIKIERY